jgi:GTP-binding protein HflX
LRGGPGETQLEVDKRLLRQRVATIKKRLEKVRSQRQQSQRARKRATIPTLAIIGYTNAGKSTLFNRLTRSTVYVADKLFATLDPTLRRLNIPDFGKVIIADTVGFVRHLPHELVEAFRATLEETKDANLLLHIVDASDPDHQNKIVAVNEVLQQIGAQNVAQLLVYNKIDLITEKVSRIDYDECEKPKRVWVSAVSGEGIDLLTQAIKECLPSTQFHTAD